MASRRIFWHENAPNCVCLLTAFPEILYLDWRRKQRTWKGGERGEKDRDYAVYFWLLPLLSWSIETCCWQMATFLAGYVIIMMMIFWFLIEYSWASENEAPLINKPLITAVNKGTGAGSADCIVAFLVVLIVTTKTKLAELKLHFTCFQSWNREGKNGL